MAWGKSKSNYGKSRKKSKYTDIEKFAYKMGSVNRALAGDNRVADSYQSGVIGPQKKTKKPLF